MQYSVWLFGFSVLFVLFERIRPRTVRELFRTGVWTDIVYLIFNGHYVGIFVAWLLSNLFQTSPKLLAALNMQLMASTPIWLQFFVLLISFDFLQWCIHNLLHRVPFLWQFHKVHHSVEQMDWIGNWRFHCFEVFFYQLLLYPFAAALRFDMHAMFWVGVVNTFAGHFSHANVRVNLGWFRYLVNTPQMHAWHHVHPRSGPLNKNFGISLSVWDWLFGTAYMPVNAYPESLGFEGVERYPANPASQFFVPFAPLFNWISAAMRSGR